MELNPNPDATEDTNNDAGANEDARLSLFPDIDPKILNRKIETACGRHCEDDHFKTREHTVWTLLKDLTVVYDAKGTPRFGFTQGNKDGPCILQGALVEGVGERKAKNVTRNHLLLVDYDTGASVDEIEAAITKLGLFALLWTTHSHMKCETLIPEDALVKYAGSLAAVTARRRGQQRGTRLRQDRPQVETEDGGRQGIGRPVAHSRYDGLCQNFATPDLPSRQHREHDLSAAKRRSGSVISRWLRHTPVSTRAPRRPRRPEFALRRWPTRTRCTSLSL